MKRRVLTFLLAVLLAVVGTAGVLSYVRGADNRALKGIQATTVLVAVKPIPAGISARQAYRDGMLRTQRFPVSAVPAGALPVISARAAALVTSAPIQPGELLLQTMLVRPSSSRGNGIPPGKFEVSMEFCLTEAVGGYIQAGSWVAVLNTSDPTGPVSGQAGCSLPQQQQLGTKTKVMIPGLQIAAVGPGPTGQSGGQSGTSRVPEPASGSSASSAILVTFVVDQEQAEELTLLNQTGVPSLALLSGAPQAGLATSDPAASKH